MHRFTSAVFIGLTVFTAACAAGPEPVNQASSALGAEQTAFWNNLQALCGQAFAGTVQEAPAGDTTFAGRELVMHVRECSDRQILVPFHVGEDRSRTWVLTRTGTGLRLKHDHRHRDGSEDEITQYGGDTAVPGSAERQEFPADAHTASLIPAASTNVWTVELVPGEAFVYALRREGTDRRFRIRFDLTRRVTAPPAPWGHD
ncbi:hypothetical protein BH23GEM3_BH23GEM3_09850 [soil metagenome]